LCFFTVSVVGAVVVVLVDWLAIVSFDAGGVFCARAGEAIASAAIDAIRSFMTFLLLFWPATAESAAGKEVA
jgi:hypothetical protein